MLEARYYSAAASHPNYGWVITGGYGDGGRKSTAEKTGDALSFDAFSPSMPLALSSHCLVSLDGGNNGDFLLTGGWTGGYNKKTYIFREGEWRPVEDMPTARSGKTPN